MVSSNKSIKLSKKRELNEMSGNENVTDLEMKIYASLLNVNKVGSQGKSNDKSEEDVFLNDFEVDKMEDER